MGLQIWSPIKCIKKISYFSKLYSVAQLAMMLQQIVKLKYMSTLFQEKQAVFVKHYVHFFRKLWPWYLTLTLTDDLDYGS